jgi:orotate phosphoribosyltransferase
MSTTLFRTDYFDQALTDLASIIEQAKIDLADVDFDTLVGTGFSGGVVIPALALALGKNYVLIRKENDDSHHGSGRLIGVLGERWLFVDDFVSSGATRNRVFEKIRDAALMQGHETELVGGYLYCNLENRYRPVGEF